MCEGSLYVRHRRATNKEELEVRSVPGTGIKGMYPAGSKMDREGNGMVCVIPGTKMYVQDVQLLSTAESNVRKWNGKQNVEVTFKEGGYFGRYADVIQFPDGACTMLVNVKDGMKCNIGVPFERDLEKTLNLNNPDVDVLIEKEGTNHTDEPIGQIETPQINADVPWRDRVRRAFAPRPTERAEGDD